VVDRASLEWLTVPQFLRGPVDPRLPNEDDVRVFAEFEYSVAVDVASVGVQMADCEWGAGGRGQRGSVGRWVEWISFLRMWGFLTLRRGLLG